MKLLLTAINAKYIHSNLAVYSLKASAEEYKGMVEIAEFTINNQADYILKEIYKRFGTYKTINHPEQYSNCYLLELCRAK